jgi:hypothetical protein
MAPDLKYPELISHIDEESGIVRAR